jgi:hypothetical protein
MVQYFEAGSMLSCRTGNSKTLSGRSAPQSMVLEEMFYSFSTKPEEDGEDVSEAALRADSNR